MKMLILILAMFPALTIADDIVAPVQCQRGICVMPIEFVKAMVDAHNELVDEVQKLKAQAKEPVKCAKTEITEPSKAPKLEKKPPPDFKLERNT